MLPFLPCKVNAMGTNTHFPPQQSGNAPGLTASCSFSMIDGIVLDIDRR
jgi:hypothetical protein